MKRNLRQCLHRLYFWSTARCYLHSRHFGWPQSYARAPRQEGSVTTARFEQIDARYSQRSLHAALVSFTMRDCSAMCPSPAYIEP